jgi:hypothetical protein
MLPFLQMRFLGVQSGCLEIGPPILRGTNGRLSVNPAVKMLQFSLVGRYVMTAYYDQPLRKLLGVLSPTINWLTEKGTVEVNSVPGEHVDAIKQLERIGVVHKRNNRLYELQKVRLKKLMDSMGMDRLVAAAPKAEAAVSTLEPVAPIAAPVDPGLN